MRTRSLLSPPEAKKFFCHSAATATDVWLIATRHMSSISRVTTAASGVDSDVDSDVGSGSGSGSGSNDDTFMFGSSWLSLSSIS